MNSCAQPEDAAAGPARQVLEPRALAELQQLDPTGSHGLVQRVLRTYVTSLERLVGQMRGSLDGGDMDALRLSVHTLKSSSAAIGALNLASMCADAEAMVRESRRVELSALIARLLIEASQVEAAVRRLLPH